MTERSRAVRGSRRVSVSAIIPTRNRPADLRLAVESVLRQTRLPDELLIVDQSADDRSRQGVMDCFRRTGSTVKVIYIHDPRINGLVEAKVRGVQESSGDIVCFLEDDVVLEPDYLLQLERGFLDTPAMLGCCGIVTNLPPLPRGYARMFHLFHRGIFHDPRVGVHGNAGRVDRALIPSRCLSGGLSAYRREVFDAIAFDLENDLFLLEDIDFSTRAAERFGDRFYINPNARLEHRMSPANRAVLGSRQRRKLREFLVFYRKRRQSGRLAHALLLLAGLLLEAGYQAASERTPSPLAGYVLGLWDGLRWKLAQEPR